MTEGGGGPAQSERYHCQAISAAAGGGGPPRSVDLVEEVDELLKIYFVV